jgi:hypothetical protein
MASKRKKSDENNQQGATTRKRSRVQPALPNGERAVDNREYGEGYGSSREELRSNEAAGDAEGQGEGLPDPVEGSLKQVPENPPMPLYEANQIITAAERYWGLNSGDIRGSKRKFHIVWARYVVCSILNRKGYTVGAIDTVLNKKKGAAHHGLKAFDSITKTYPKYRDQVVQFDRYLWNKQTANSREGYNSVAANR